MRTRTSPLSLIISGAPILLLATQVYSQDSAAGGGSGLLWEFVVGIAVIIAFGGIVAWFYSRRETEPVVTLPKGKGIVYEWKPEHFGEKSDPGSKAVDKSSKDAVSAGGESANPSLHGVDIEDIKDKMEKIRFERLPINALEGLNRPRQFTPLPTGDEERLLAAIDDSDVEFVESESARSLALDVLAGYRTSNAVDAIGNMAIYDLSSSLRAKAVGILADIDHESVFESVILSCADPSREVRAAGAKALFKLSFKRTDAWTRLAECGDVYRMSQAAKAAIEADFVDRSLERLVHEDGAYAEEALALLALMIRAGETEPLLEYMVNGEKKDIKLALLRVFRIVDCKTLKKRLGEILDSGEVPREIELETRAFVKSREEVSAVS